MNRRDFVRFTLAATLTAEVHAFAPPVGKGLWATPASQVNGALAAVRDRQILLAISQQLETAYYRLLDAEKLSINDDILRRQLYQQFSELMDTFVARRLIVQYKVVCDDSNNPPSVVDTGLPAVIVVWRTERHADRYTRWSAYPTSGLKLEAA